MKKLLVPVILVGMVLLGRGTASAVPILQLYIEGATYEQDTDTWVLTPPGSSGGAPFRIWAIGNVGGPGSEGTISDVRLSIAYSEEYPAFGISLVPSQAGGLGDGQFEGVSDPSVPGVPTLNTVDVRTSLGLVDTGPDGLVTNGGTPVLSTGKNLPSHGVFGADTVWKEYSLGDFWRTDSPVGDFIDFFPTELFAKSAQINVYEVSAIGFSGATLHFDLYNSVAGKNGARFAPFSHDADGEANIIPEPASFVVWFLIGLSWAGSAWTYQYRRRWQEWRREEEGAVAAGVHQVDLLDRSRGTVDEVEEEVDVRSPGRSARR